MSQRCILRCTLRVLRAEWARAVYVKTDLCPLEALMHVCRWARHEIRPWKIFVSTFIKHYLWFFRSLNLKVLHWMLNHWRHFTFWLKNSQEIIIVIYGGNVHIQGLPKSKKRWANKLTNLINKIMDLPDDTPYPPSTICDEQDFSILVLNINFSCTMIESSSTCCR